MIITVSILSRVCTDYW